MSERHIAAPDDQPDNHIFTTPEAAAEGENDDWENEPAVDPDDTQRDGDVFEGSDDE